MIFLLSLANAAPAYEDQGFVLTAAAGAAFAGGVGAPTVEWDGSARQFVMFFESPAVAADIPEDCVSYYRIGRATSPDGVNWTVNENPVLEPDHADPLGVRRCAINQPAVVFDGTAWHMVFSQATTKDTDTRNEPAGIGYARSNDGVTWETGETPVVTPDANGIGLASAAIVDGQMYVLYSVAPHLYLTSRPAAGGPWTPVAAPVLENTVLGDWATTWVFGASLTCDETAGNPFQLTFGADDAALVRNLGIASSPDAESWAIDAGSPLTGGTLVYGSLNHWDVLAVGADASALWYSKTDDATGLKAIGVAVSGTPDGQNHGRTCPNQWPPDVDTGGDSDTGDSGGGDSGGDSGVTDTGTAGGDDTGGKDVAGEDCGCNGAGAGGAGALAALSALVLGVRRRPAQ